MKKKYKLTASAIKRMIPDLGYAFATDKITVEGKKVHYMVRQSPDRKEDSGWIFYGGEETQEYMDGPNNTAIFEVNTIVNYDPEIIPFLTYPPGTEIERNAEGRLELITQHAEKPDVILMPPVESGFVPITKTWRFENSSRMLRRFESGSLVIWKPEFTLWIRAYTGIGESIQERVNGILEEKSPKAYALQQEETNGLLKLRYQLTEKSDGKDQASVYMFGFAESEEIHIAIYYDRDEYLEEIDKIWKSLSRM